MTWKISRRDSIYTQLLKLLLAAAFAACIVFIVLGITGQYLADKYLEQTDYGEKKNLEYVEKLQEYVDEEGLTTKDTDLLNEWVKTQKMLFVQIYLDNIQVFNSEYPEKDIWEEEIEAGNYDWESYYVVEFADGTANVVITGSYMYQLYNYVTIVELLLSFVCFLVLVLFGIRKKMAYIQKLSEEIEILEGGSLEYEITVKGKDEIAALASGLEDMRVSFGRLIRQDAEMVQENQRIVTEMSHDLRTPVTSIMLYTEILKKGKYANTDQLREYLDKIEQKAYRMKQLTDHLFEYSLIAGEQEIQLDEPEQYTVLFYDLFSETCSYLEQKGFQVASEVEWFETRHQISLEYMMRIMDNITSNIVKYADPEFPVKISSLQEGRMAGFVFENRKKTEDNEEESTGIGLQNIKNMMQKMGGQCEVKEEQESFALKILFPRIEQ